MQKNRLSIDPTNSQPQPKEGSVQEPRETAVRTRDTKQGDFVLWETDGKLTVGQCVAVREDKRLLRPFRLHGDEIRFDDREDELEYIPDAGLMYLCVAADGPTAICDYVSAKKTERFKHDPSWPGCQEILNRLARWLPEMRKEINRLADYFFSLNYCMEALRIDEPWGRVQVQRDLHGLQHNVNEILRKWPCWVRPEFKI